MRQTLTLVERKSTAIPAAWIISSTITAITRMCLIACVGDDIINVCRGRSRLLGRWAWIGNVVEV